MKTVDHITDRAGERTIAIAAADARMLASALDDFPDGASLHPGWGPKAQVRLTMALQRLRAAVLEDARQQLAEHNAAALAQRLEREMA